MEARLCTGRPSSVHNRVKSQLLDSNKECDEKSVILRHFLKTGSKRHLFEANGVESCVIIISTKGLKSTWWMLISPISTGLSLHRCPKCSSLLRRRLKRQHIAHIKTVYCFRVDEQYLNCNIQLMKCSRDPRAHASLYLPSTPVLINSNPLSTPLPSCSCPSLPLPDFKKQRKSK